MVGATVRVKDVNSGVITDMDGKFTIKATPGDVWSFHISDMKPRK